MKFRSHTLQLLLLASLGGGLGCATVGAEATSRPLTAGPGEAEQCGDVQMLPTSGLYVVTPLNQVLDEAVLDSPNISGIAIRVGWSKLQPSAQEPLFAVIDAQILLARKYNKKVSLSIEAGVETPGWVYNLGARPFTIIRDESAGDLVCQSARLPIPWDPVYLDAFKALITAAGRRYNRSSVLTHIKVTGLSGVGPQAALPHQPSRALSSSAKSCRTTDEAMAWADVGYSRARITQTWRELLDLFSQSFTSHRLAMVVDAQGFPAAGERTGSHSDRAYDTDLVPDLIKMSLEGRQARMQLQSNDLTNTSPYPFPLRFSDETILGYQLRWAVSGDRGARMNSEVADSAVAIFDSTVRRGVSAHARYLEVQLADVQNPQLASSMAGGRVLLRRGTPR